MTLERLCATLKKKRRISPVVSKLSSPVELDSNLSEFPREEAEGIYQYSGEEHKQVVPFPLFSSSH